MSERRTLPESGQDWSVLKKLMTDMAQGDVDWRNGKASVYVFHSGDDVMDVAHDAYGMFIAENGLGPAAFPSLRQMEREVVDMALNLQQAPEGARGSMTSGGTESILLAIKACRDQALSLRDIAGVPEIVVPHTAHPAFDKGAHLMGLKVIRVPVGDDLRADVEAMAQHITPNTIMLVGSAPCFPFGLIDPIQDLAALALRSELWLHVDACVGGYINPFMREVRGDFPAYDFAIEGVSSMSLDLHKYGYAAKGASTVLYREKSLADYQGFHFDDWPCGHMYTPTFAGTRPGGAIAAAWAVLNYLGHEGYVERARRINNAKNTLIEGCSALGFHIHGDPEASIVAFGWSDGDILAVGERLYGAGWFSSRTQSPDGIQCMISPEHEKTIPKYLNILEKAKQSVVESGAGRSSDGISYS